MKILKTINYTFEASFNVKHQGCYDSENSIYTASYICPVRGKYEVLGSGIGTPWIPWLVTPQKQRHDEPYVEVYGQENTVHDP